MKQNVAKIAPAANPCLLISYGIRFVYGTFSQKNAIINAARKDVMEPILDVMYDSSLADDTASM